MKTFQEQLIPILHNLRQKVEERTLLNLFYEASITLITKPEKDSRNKKEKRKERKVINNIFSK